MNRYLATLISLLFVAYAAVDCTKHDEKKKTDDSLGTLAAENVTETGATACFVTNTDCLTCGVTYTAGVEPAPGKGTMIIAKGVTGKGEYHVELSGLTDNTTYFYKAFLMDTRGRYHYGGAVSFKTHDSLEEGIYLDRTRLDLLIDESWLLVPTITPRGHVEDKLEWTSSDRNVAVVNEGKVTALALGTTVISVTSTPGGYTAKCKVSVQSPVLKMTVEPRDTVIAVGSILPLVTKTIPEDAVKGETVWSSSDSKVATVDGNGNVRGISDGSAVITATDSRSGVFASCAVVVRPVPEKVTLDVYENTLGVGEEFTIIATVLPENAIDRKIFWKSSNVGIAAVDAAGNVVGLGKGTATITATTRYGGKSAECRVVVLPATAGIELDIKEKTVEPGESFTITASVIPYDAKDREIRWTSSDNAVASVNDEGVVTALKNGTADITATTVKGGFSAKCAVTVATAAE